MAECGGGAGDDIGGVQHWVVIMGMGGRADERDDWARSVNTWCSQDFGI